MEILFIVVSIPVLALAMSLTCMAGFKRLRRKGYGPLGSVLLMLSAFSLGVSACLLALPGMVFSQDAGLLFATFFWLPTIVFATAIALMLWLLPHRNARISGARRPRFPLRAAGIGLISLGAAGVLWAIWQGTFLTGSAKLFGILAGFGTALIALGVRAKSSSSVEEAIQADPRAPVLYLRPFMQEMVPFVTGKKSTHGRYLSVARNAISAADDDATDWKIAVRFEEYFRGPLEAEVGPFVALGNPEDYLPPEGAARTYSSDSEWRARVERLVAACSCMVAEAGISSNLEWELRYLRQEGLQSKLFIMTPPAPLKINWLDQLFFWAGQKRFVPWSAFTTTMTACGYEIEEDPGHGSVLTFDADGKSVIVKQHAIQPEDYVASIRDFLETNGGYSHESFDKPLVTPPEPPPPAPPEPNDPPVASPAPVVQPRGWWSRLMSSTNTWVVLFLLLIVVVSFVPSFVSQSREKARIQELKAFASQIGFTFNDGELTITDPDIAGTSLVDHGNNEGTAFYGLEGERDGSHVTLFDYRYIVKTDDRKGGEDSTEVFQTVAAFCSANRHLPPFHLQEYSLWNALSVTHAEEHVEIKESPEFTKRFILQSEDKAAIIRTFSPQLRSYLMNSYPRGKWHIEGSGRCLVLYQPKDRVKPENWGSFLEETSQTAKGFFQNVGPDQAPQTAAPK
jgi:hypothetical protein